MGTPARTGEWAKSVAAKYGNSPGAEPVKDALKWGSKKFLTEKQREALAQQPKIVEKRAEGLLGAVLKSPIGWPFRQDFDRKATGVICGTPYSQAGVIVDAIDSLTRLLVQSVKEDDYGQASGHVVSIIRVYMSTLKAIQGFLQTLEPHWTDVEFVEEKRAEVKEVNDVVDSLKDGLSAVFGAFVEFFPNMGVSEREIKEIKGLFTEGRKKSDVGKEGKRSGEGGEMRREMEQLR
jgi:nucleoporin NDC1